MSNYTKSTNFASKDSLLPGNPSKIVKGTEIDTEFNNIATAIASKADGFIYYMASNTMMGRNVSDVAEYLKNPLNEQILMELSKKVEEYWNH